MGLCWNLWQLRGMEPFVQGSSQNSLSGYKCPLILFPYRKNNIQYPVEDNYASYKPLKQRCPCLPICRVRALCYCSFDNSSCKSFTRILRFVLVSFRNIVFIFCTATSTSFCCDFGIRRILLLNPFTKEDT